MSGSAFLLGDEFCFRYLLRNVVPSGPVAYCCKRIHTVVVHHLSILEAGEVREDGKDAAFETVFKGDIGTVFNYALFL